VFGSLAAGEPEEFRSRILARGLSGDELAATAAAVAGAAGRRLERALAARPIRLAISGKDLLAAGVPSGRRIGEALAAALAARRDGRISRRRELAFAVAAARGEPS
jgi:hypothetical protein